MTWRNSTDRHGLLSGGLHWLMLALFVGVYAWTGTERAQAGGSGSLQASRSRL
jgi:cytochrome b561